MYSQFIDLARLGKNDWWRYLVGTLVICSLWLGFSMVLGFSLGVWVTLDNDPRTYVDLTNGTIVGIDPFINYIVLNAGHAAMLLGLWLTVRYIHRRPFRSLITALDRLDWRLLALGFGIYFLLVGLSSLIDCLLDPGVYTFTGNLRRFAWTAPVVVLLTPLQTTTEELVFRGYLLQGLGLLTRGRAFPAVASALIFMLPHMGNPEVKYGFWSMGAYYLGLGLLLALVTLKANSLEAAIGAHAAGNLFVALIVNFSDSSLKTDSLFTISKLDPVAGLICFVVVAAIFYRLLFFLRIKVGPRHEPPEGPREE